MAPRKYVADSEEEDEGDDSSSVSYPEEKIVEHARPEPEQLSPQHRPSSPEEVTGVQRPTNVTESSFFRNVYDRQHTLAVQQSYLIEKIVRQSQQAASSGISEDVALPQARKQAGEEASFATEVTSPMILSRARMNRALVSDGASEITTPRMSDNRGLEWEVPSSPANAGTSRFGTSKRSSDAVVSGPTASESVVQETPIEDRRGASPEPAAKRAKLSHDEPELPSESANFYIAASHLTTMQKLEYQKVNITMNAFTGPAGQQYNQRSSYAATIPYSTPSGYSSIPPWERSPAPANSSRQNEVININSSPDVITSESKTPNRTNRTASDEESFVPDKTPKPDTTSRRRTPASKKKETTYDEDEDELGQDDNYDPDLPPPELYKPRPSRRRAAAAVVSISQVENDTDAPMEVSEQRARQTSFVSRSPAPASKETDPLELPSESPPKARGRKKKQDVIELPPSDAEVAEDFYPEEDPDFLGEESDAEFSIPKPQKKRTPARRTETRKNAKKASPEPPKAPEPQRSHSPEQDDDSDASDVVVRKGKTTDRRKNKPAKDVEVDSEEDGYTDESDIVMRKGKTSDRKKAKPTKLIEINPSDQDDETDESDFIVSKGKAGNKKNQKTTKAVEVYSSDQDDDTDSSDIVARKRKTAGADKNKNQSTKETETTKKTETKESRPACREVNSNSNKTPSKPDVDSDLHTPSRATSTGGEPPTKATEARDDKPIAKKQVPAVTPAKATYRVGLSKRTRIAPLLKTIRK